MNKHQFAVTMSAAGFRPGTQTEAALELVLVHGKNQTEAAAAIGINQSVISRALLRLPDPLPNYCPCCGQSLGVADE